MAIFDGMLWCDLETTGSNLPESEIIQIGCILTDKRLAEQAVFQITVKPNAPPETWKPIAYEMHDKNGLLQASQQSIVTLDMAEAALLDWLLFLVPDKKTIFHLAGSGVAHFDRPFINHWMPRFAKRLAYSAYDVGHVRRFGALAGISPNINEAKDHTSIADLRCHIAEARYWLGLISLGAIHAGPAEVQETSILQSIANSKS